MTVSTEIAIATTHPKSTRSRTSNFYTGLSVDTRSSKIGLFCKRVFSNIEDYCSYSLVDWQTIKLLAVILKEKRAVLQKRPTQIKLFCRRALTENYCRYSLVDWQTIKSLSVILKYRMHIYKCIYINIIHIQSHLECHFRKLKARTSLLPRFNEKRRSSFEL